MKVMLVVAMTVAAYTATPLVPAARAQQQPAPAAITAPSPAEVAAKAKLDGTMAASNVGGWFGRSVTIGVLTGLIGTGVTYAVAANSSVELPPDKQFAVAKESAEYRVVYEKAYADKVRGKRKSTALSGGLLGTAVVVAAVLASSGG